MDKSNQGEAQWEERRGGGLILPDVALLAYAGENGCSNSERTNETLSLSLSACLRRGW